MTLQNLIFWLLLLGLCLAALIILGLWLYLIEKALRAIAKEES